MGVLWMIEVIEWIKEVFTNKDNIFAILMIPITLLVTYFLGIIPKIFKWIGKLFGILGKWLTNIKNKLKEIKKDRDYKRKIGQIERGEIPVTDEFLFMKSPEKNPELKKIYQMMDDGEIKSTALYEMQKDIRKNLSPELKEGLSNVAKIVAKNASQNVPKLKQPKIPPFDK